MSAARTAIGTLMLGLAGCAPAPVPDGPTVSTVAATAAAAAPDLRVEGWAPPTADTATAQLYGTVYNAGAAADTLVSVLTCLSRQAYLTDAGGRPVDALPIAAGTRVEFAPGGRGIRLEGLTRPLEAGDIITLALTFRRAGLVVVPVEVADPAAGAALSTS
jgi:copper(I)-binding protein